MKAKITWNEPDGITTIKVNGHMLQIGGTGGDLYCHAHESFECMDNLTVEEKAAIKGAACEK